MQTISTLAAFNKHWKMEFHLFKEERETARDCLQCWGRDTTRNSNDVPTVHQENIRTRKQSVTWSQGKENFIQATAKMQIHQLWKGHKRQTQVNQVSKQKPNSQSENRSQLKSQVTRQDNDNQRSSCPPLKQLNWSWILTTLSLNLFGFQIETLLFTKINNGYWSSTSKVMIKRR